MVVLMDKKEKSEFKKFKKECGRKEGIRNRRKNRKFNLKLWKLKKSLDWFILSDDEKRKKLLRFDFKK